MTSLCTISKSKLTVRNGSAHQCLCALYQQQCIYSTSKLQSRNDRLDFKDWPDIPYRQAEERFSIVLLSLDTLFIPFHSLSFPKQLPITSICCHARYIPHPQFVNMRCIILAAYIYVFVLFVISFHRYFGARKNPNSISCILRYPTR